MRFFLAFLFLKLLISVNLYAKNLSAHVHGDVHLDIATDKNQLLIMLKAPSESFLGFEYKAKTNKQKELVKQIKEEWDTNLFKNLGASSLKDCSVEKSAWKQQFSGENHSSILAESYVRCSRPLKDRFLEITFKKNYNRIKSIKLQLLREDGSVLSKRYIDSVFKINI